jgi:hypothetical protein
MRLAALLCALLSCGGCLPIHVEGSRLERERAAPLTVHVLSEPPGALVRDAASGEVLGRTPLETRPLDLVFEEWTVVGDEEALRALAGAGEEDGWLAVSQEPAGETRVARGEAVTLRYLLTLEGYAPREISYTLDPEELPGLERNPEVTLVVHLEQAAVPAPSGR